VQSAYYSRGSASKSSKKDKLFGNMNARHMDKMNLKKKEFTPVLAQENSARKGSTTSGVTTRSKKAAFSNLNDLHLKKLKEGKASIVITSNKEAEDSFRSMSKPAPVPKISKFKSLNEKLASRYEIRSAEKPIALVNSNRSDPPVSASMDNVLSPAEQQIFGDRCPPGYSKIRLLGKGSKSMVWAAKSPNNGIVAIK